MPGSVLIVDDHSNFRVQARALVELAGYTVAGEAATAAEAVEEARDLRPDFVLLDVQLPDRDGFAVADALCALEKPPVIVLISTRDADDYGGRVRRSCVRAFITKADLTADGLKEALTA